MAIIKQDYGEIGGGFDSPYKLLQITINDSVSANITVPSNTDFIIVNTYTQSMNGVYDLSSDNAEIGVLQKVNDSFNSNGSYAGGYVSNAQTITWTNATTISQTRENSRGWITYFFCQYE